MKPRGIGNTPGQRQGGVLVATVLVVLALGLVSTGLLFISTQETWIARSAEDAMRARLAAEMAVRTAVTGWRTDTYRDLEVGGRRSADPVPSIDGMRITVTVERLAGRLYLIRGEAEREPSPGAVASASALVRVLGVDELWEPFSAAIVANGPVEIREQAAVTGTGESSPTAGEPDAQARACPPEAIQTLYHVFGVAERPAIHQRIPPDESGGWPTEGSENDADVDAWARFDRLGPLHRANLLELADRILDGNGTGSTMREGWCHSTPGVHGVTLVETCGGPATLTFVHGDLSVSDGTAQGVLVVDGDLELGGTATFAGAIHVRGRLIVRDDARIHGAVVVAGEEGARIQDRAKVTYDVCALWSAWTTTPGLNRPLQPAERHWVPIP